MSTVREHTIICPGGQLYTISLAKEVAPGLLVFRLPDGMWQASAHRWRIGHHSGLSIADAMRREDAIKGAELLGTLADWTQDADNLKASINAADLFAKLSYAYCVPPGSEPFAAGYADASSNGRYTEDDVRKAADEYKADGMNALEVLVDMAHRAPWMGLDTEAFNEAHDRIVQLCGAN
ncbi:hypothetical protein AB0F24_17705 [Streptomyces platensis]|uniref:hypothetical protein n=1 Tax=Streptomyces platensis TaxID=58346 RepID=UPI0033DFEF01